MCLTLGGAWFQDWSHFPLLFGGLKPLVFIFDPRQQLCKAQNLTPPPGPQKRDQAWNQAPQSQAHLEADNLLPWLTKLCFETNILKCVWPPHGQSPLYTDTWFTNFIFLFEFLDCKSDIYIDGGLLKSVHGLHHRKSQREWMLKDVRVTKLAPTECCSGWFVVGKVIDHGS